MRLAAFGVFREAGLVGVFAYSLPEMSGSFSEMPRCFWMWRTASKSPCTSGTPAGLAFEAAFAGATGGGIVRDLRVEHEGDELEVEPTKWAWMLPRGCGW